MVRGRPRSRPPRAQPRVVRVQLAQDRRREFRARDRLPALEAQRRRGAPQFARQIRRRQRPHGDRFEHQRLQRLDRIVRELARPVTLMEGEVFVTASIGIAVSGAATDTPETLLRNADAALQSARQQGGSLLVTYSEALNAENMSRGVHVCALCPGFTWSEFHDVLGTRDKMNQMPGFLWLRADDVAREGYEAVMKGQSVVINGRVYRFVVWLTGALPRSLSRLVSGAAGRRYRKT